MRRKAGTSDGCRLIMEGNRTWAFQWGKKEENWFNEWQNFKG